MGAARPRDRGGQGLYRDVIEYRAGLSGGVTAVNRSSSRTTSGRRADRVPGELAPRRSRPKPSPLVPTPLVRAREQLSSTSTTRPLTGLPRLHRRRGAAGTARSSASAARSSATTARSSSPTSTPRPAATRRTTRTSSNAAAAPVYPGVRDPWDKTSPFHRWLARYSPRSLGAALGVGRLRSVRVNRRGSSGRIVYATFRGTAGRARLHGWEGIRARLGLSDAPEHDQAHHLERLDRPSEALAGIGSHGLARELTGASHPHARAHRSGSSGARRADGPASRPAASRRAGRLSLPHGGAGLYRVVSAGDAGPAVHVREARADPPGRPGSRRRRSTGC